MTMDTALDQDVIEQGASTETAEPAPKRRYSRSFLAVARGELGTMVSPKMGRPTKLSPQIARAILKVISKGGHFSPACVAAGVSHQTALRWIEQGNHDVSENVKSPFATFVRALHQAASQAESNIVSQVYDHTEKDWRAGAFLLERRHPERWGKKEQATNITNVVISDALVTQLVDAMRVATGGSVVIDVTPQQLPSPLPDEDSST